eukprot:TCONS_00062242-protein
MKKLFVATIIALVLANKAQTASYFYEDFTSYINFEKNATDPFTFKMSFDESEHTYGPFDDHVVFIVEALAFGWTPVSVTFADSVSGEEIHNWLAFLDSDVFDLQVFPVSTDPTTAVGKAQVNLVFNKSDVVTAQTYVNDILPNCTIRYDGVTYFIPISVNQLSLGYNDHVGVPVQFSQTFSSPFDPTLDYQVFCGHLNVSGYFYHPMSPAYSIYDTDDYITFKEVVIFTGTDSFWIGIDYDILTMFKKGVMVNLGGTTNQTVVETDAQLNFDCSYGTNKISLTAHNILTNEFDIILKDNLAQRIYVVNSTLVKKVNEPVKWNNETNNYELAWSYESGVMMTVTVSGHEIGQPVVIAFIEEVADEIFFFVEVPDSSFEDVFVSSKNGEQDAPLFEELPVPFDLEELIPPSELTYYNCSTRRCPIEFTIYGIDENKTVCNISHNFLPQFNFSCHSIPDNRSASVECFNETMVFTYKAYWRDHPIVNITCYHDIEKMNVWYQDGVELEVEPVELKFDHGEIQPDMTMNLHFEYIRLVKNVSQVRVLEVDFDRKKTVVHDITNITMFDFNSTVGHIPFTFVHGKSYRIWFELRNGVYIDVFAKTFTVPEISVTTLKKYHAVAHDFLIDGYYPYNISASMGDGFYRFNYTKWIWTYMGHVNETEDEILHIPSMPLVKDCYLLQVSVEGLNNLEMRSNQTMCTEIGINATMEFDFAVSLGVTSFFRSLVTREGTDSCLAIDVDGTLFANNMTACTMHGITQALGSATQLTFNQSQTQNGDAIDLAIAEHLFSAAGEYTIKMIAKNNVHDQVEEYEQSIISLDCRVPELTILGAGLQEDIQVTITRGQKHRIETQIEIDCSEKHYRNNFTMFTGYRLDQPIPFSSEIMTQSLELHSPPSAFEYGKYKICSTAYMLAEPRFKTIKCGYLEVIPSPLFIDVVGGNSVQAGTSRNYVVNTTLTYDPDEYRGLQFYFLCRDFNDPEFNLTYHNVSTHLEESRPGIVPITAANDNGGCYGTGPGKLKTVTVYDRMTRLSTSQMRVGKSVELSVCAYSSMPEDKPRFQCSKQTLTIIEGDPPNIYQLGIINHGVTVAHNDKHMVQGLCKEDESCKDNGRPIIWEWVLEKCAGEHAPCTNVSAADYTRMVETPRKGVYYGARRGEYDSDTWYRLYTYAYRTDTVYGVASSLFYVNSPPYNGTCRSAKDSYILLVGATELSCQYWTDANLPLTYSFYTVKNSVAKEFCRSYNPICNASLPAGNPMDDYKLTVFVNVKDSRGGLTTYPINVTVQPPPDIDASISDINGALSGEDSRLNVLQASGNIVEMTNDIYVFSSLINLAPDMPSNNTANMTTEEKHEIMDIGLNRIKLRDQLANFTMSINTSDIEQQNFLTGTMSGVLQKPNEVSPDLQNQVLSKAEDCMKSMSTNIGALDSAGQILAVTGVANMVQKSMAASSLMTNVQKGNDSDLMAMKSLGSGNTSALTGNVNKARSQIDGLQSMLGQTVLPGGDTVQIELDGLSLGVGKSLPGTTATSFGAGSVSINFNAKMLEDPNLSLQEQSEEFTEVKIVQMENPFGWDETSSKIKSKMTGINMAGKNGPKSVTGTPEPMELWIENHPLPVNESEIFEMKNNNDTKNYSSMSVEDNGEQWSYHVTEIRNESARIVIDLFNKTYCSSFTVYMRQDKQPTTEKYLMKWSLPNNETCKWKNESEHIGESINLLSDENQDEFECQLATNLIFISDKEGLDGDFHFGLHCIPWEIKIQKENLESSDIHGDGNSRKRRSTIIDVDKVDTEYCVVIKPPPPTPAPTLGPGVMVPNDPVYTEASLNYTFDITKAKCLFWNETTETFGSDGCWVGSLTTPERTQCLCTHLTDFGGDVMVAPNPIDMGAVFEGLKNLGDNLGVLMVILTIFLVYILLCVWSRKKDRKDDIDKRLVTVDCTSGDESQQSLLLNIITGAGDGSGTTARVSCEIMGSKGKTGIIPLTYQDKSLFKTRSAVAIKVLLSQDIGDLETIRVFHDNSGKSPHWYLRSILITDIQTKKEYPFIYDSWLGVAETQNPTIDTTLKLADEKDMKKFHLVFATKISQGLLDGHIWFSIFLRPKRSSFTRVRRLSACLALLFLTMLTNAMFFGVGDNPANRKIVWLGEFKINFTGIMIGIQSSLIVIIPSVIIIEIFRRVAPKKEKKDKVENASEEFEDAEAIEASQENQTKEKEPFMFPNWFQYIGYFFVVASSGSSALLCFFYSMMWGPKKSNEWLASMFAGFFQSVLVIQPIKAVFVAILFAAICRKPVSERQPKEEELRRKPLKKDKKKYVSQSQKQLTDEELDEEIEERAGVDGLIDADEVPIIRPSDTFLERCRKARIREKMTGVVFKDICVYLIFLGLVAKLAYGEKDMHTYYFREDMMNMFQQSKYQNGPVFDLVSNHGYMYSWVRDTLVPSIFSGPWYNDEMPKYQGFIDNHQNYLVSIPRLRQSRVPLNSCPIPDDFASLINHCEKFYDMTDEETGTYQTSWKPLNKTNPETWSKRKRRDTSAVWIAQNPDSEVEMERSRRGRRNTDAGTGTSTTTPSQYQKMTTGSGRNKQLRRRKLMIQNNGGGSSNLPIYYVNPEALLPDGTVVSCKDRWEFFSSSELRGFPVPGRVTTYGGGGYVANLGYNEETSWTVLADLHSKNWFDKQTRAAFVEFTVYNANVNLFLTAFLYTETLPTGGAFPWADFKVFNGYRYSAKEGLQSLWAELVFICFITFFAIREIRKMIRFKKAYFTSFFNWIEVVLMPLYLIMFGLIVIRWLTTAENIKSFKHNPKDFVSFQYSAAADSALMAVIGIVCFLLNIKFLKLLQFAKLFFVTGQVIKAFAYPLTFFMIPFTLYFLLFCWCGHLGFGAQNENYQTIIRSIVTQFLHLLGATDFDGVRDASPIFGPMYYIAYAAFMMFIVFNIFMAIICEAIDEDYDEEFEKQAGDIQMVEFLTKKVKDIIGIEDVELDLDADGEDLPEEKLKSTEKTMEDFDDTIERLYHLVDKMKVPETGVAEEDTESYGPAEQTSIEPFEMIDKVDDDDGVQASAKERPNSPYVPEATDERPKSPNESEANDERPNSPDGTEANDERPNSPDDLLLQ